MSDLFAVIVLFLAAFVGLAVIFIETKEFWK
jgi:hypothetical protein